MSEQTVRVAGFRYIDHNDVERVAHTGEVIDFSDEDTKRGLAVAAFEVPEVYADDDFIIGPASTDDELEEFAKNAKVAEVVAAANGDPELAHRLLAAENAANGGEPRTGVAKGLAAIVGEG